MMEKLPALRIALTVTVLGLGGMPAGAAAAEVKVFSTIALQTALEELAPTFGTVSGHRVSSEFAITGPLAKRLQDGEAADVFVGTRSAIDELVKAGKLQKGSEVDLANSSVGMAVRKGSARPDISTPEALKRALSAARAISYTNPASGGASGVHFSKVLEQLGIAAEMKSRTRYPPGGGFAARLLVTGDVDLAVQQNSELLAVPGVELLGPLPMELQSVTLFAAAVPTAAPQPEAAKALIRYLQTPQAAAVLKAKGLDPIAK